MLQEIAGHLPLKDLVALTQVSKQHHNYISSIVTQRLKNQEWECTIWFDDKKSNFPLIGVVYPHNYYQQGKDFLEQQGKITDILPPGYFIYCHNKHRLIERRYHLGKQPTLFSSPNNHCYLDKNTFLSRHIPIYTTYQKGAIYCYVLYS